MQSQKLKAKLVEKSINYELGAKKLGISKNTFSKKMNNIGKFTLFEANKLADLLEMDDLEKVEIFLD